MNGAATRRARRVGRTRADRDTGAIAASLAPVADALVGRARSARRRGLAAADRGRPRRAGAGARGGRRASSPRPGPTAPRLPRPRAASQLAAARREAARRVLAARRRAYETLRDACRRGAGAPGGDARRTAARRAAAGARCATGSGASASVRARRPGQPRGGGRVAATAGPSSSRRRWSTTSSSRSATRSRRCGRDRPRARRLRARLPARARGAGERPARRGRGARQVAVVDVVEVGRRGAWRPRSSRSRHGLVTAQVYEYTGGLRVGDPAVGHGPTASARLGPGLLGGVFDGLLRPLAGRPHVARARRARQAAHRPTVARSCRPRRPASAVGARDGARHRPDAPRASSTACSSPRGRRATLEWVADEGERRRRRARRRRRRPAGRR